MKTSKTKVTPFGTICREIRSEHSEYLKDMASKLGVTMSYLSLVERGARYLPIYWVDIIIDEYKLSDEKAAELCKAAELEQVEIIINGLPDKEKAMIKIIADILPSNDHNDHMYALIDIAKLILGEGNVSVFDRLNKYREMAKDKNK